MMKTPSNFAKRFPPARALPRALPRAFRHWAVCLCLAGASSAPGGQVTTQVREVLREAHALSSTETEAVLQQAAQASVAGVPGSLILARLREGLVKQATAKQLIGVLEASQQAHQDASALLRGDRQGLGRGRRQPEAERFHELLVRALESGVPRAAFEELFKGEAGPHGLGAQRMQAIVEAGEMLHLAGLDAEVVRRFMLACRDRQVRRMEALRAARQAIVLHGQGLEADAMLQWIVRDFVMEPR